MKNLTEICIIKDEEESIDTKFKYNSKKLYIVTFKHYVFACETYSRKQAINMASNSTELEYVIDQECLSHGRSISMYGLPNLNVIQVKPWHRFGSWEKGEGKRIHLYVYFPPGSMKPMVFGGESTILEYANSSGIIKKVKIYSDSDFKEDTGIFEEHYACSPRIPITYPINARDPYEIV